MLIFLPTECRVERLYASVTTILYVASVHVIDAETVHNVPMDVLIEKLS